MDAVKTRYLILIWLLLPEFLPINLVMDKLGIPFHAYWWDATFYYSFFALLALAIFFTFKRHPPNWPNLIGPQPNKEAYYNAFAFSIYLWVASLATSYLTFYPLSFVIPDFVSFWFLPYSPVVYVSDSAVLWIPTLVNLVSLIVFAPVFEELLFRGILLRRFSAKYGTWKAILFSSALFGIVHPDTLGAILFGIGMCILYLRYGSFLLIVATHCLWNCAYFLIELLYTVVHSEEQHSTLTEFQDNWPWGLMYIVIFILWTYAILKTPLNTRKWTLKPA